MVEVVLEQGLEDVELGCGGVVHVSLGRGGLAQGGELLFAHLVILKLVGVDEGLELVEDGVGDLKLGWAGDLVAVLGDVACGEVEVPVVAHDVIDDALEFARLDLDVGHDAAALTDLAAVCRVEDACGAVGGGFLVGAVLVAVAVVELLDESSAGDVVLGDGDLEDAVIGEVACGLYQSLAKGARADDHGAVEVLQGSRGDFAGAGRAAVDEHCQGDVGVDGVDGGLVGALAGLVASTHDEDLGALGDEEADDLDGRLDDAAAIAAQVEDDVLDARVVLECDEGVAHLLCRLLVKGCQVDVADVASRDAVVGDGVDADGLAVEREGLHAVLIVGAHDRHRQVGVGLSLESLAHLVAGPGVGAVAIDHDDAVASAQAGACGGAALVRAADVDALLAVDGAFHQVAADAAILAGAQRHEFVGLDGGDILGVGVDVVEHRVDGIFDALLGVDGVDIERVQFLVERVENVQAACHGCIIVDRLVVVGERCRCCQAQGHASPGEVFERLFHYIYIVCGCENTIIP